MRRLAYVVGCAVMAAALVACSGGRDKPKQREAGAVPKAAPCAVDPRRLGEVQKIRDFGNGRGCGVSNAWRVYSLQGVAMSQPIVLNCAMINSFAGWISNTMQPAAEDRFGKPVIKLTVPSAYSCRTRNNKFGARLSEHAQGNAVDISMFHFEDGRKVAVEQGWFSRREKKFIAEVRAKACGPFRTVLGPGSDRYHDDHLHFDLQRHRSGGAYCR